MKVGPVRYARNGSVRLAYRVLGEANRPLVWVPGWVSNVDEYDDPIHPYTALAERLTPSTQLIVWDKRGTGLSDPVDHVPSIDDRMDDLRAVMDAADVEEAALFGASEGGPMSLMFAATYPERVRSVVLYGSAARFSSDPPSYPWGFTRAEIDAQLRDIDDHWGQGALVELFMTSIAEVEGVRSLFGRAQRRGASPTMASLLWQALMEIDVRDVLGSVEAPTLVLHHSDGDQVAPVEGARDLAARLPNGVFHELPPGDHLAFDFGEAMSDAILEFVVDEHRDAVSVDRTLATIMFTDIVGSTASVSEHGDDRWRRQLDLHEQLVERHVGGAGGQKVKDTGDGIFAVFDGPTKAARCALGLVADLATHGLSIRAGVHTGECERRGNDWSGLGVHVGARVAALAGAGEVLVSRTVRDLSAGSGLAFEERGTHVLKGLSEPWQLFRVTNRGT